MKQLALALTASFALPLLAAQERTDRDLERALDGLLRRFDRDDDGRVSRAEFPGRPFRFTRLDRDGDGFFDEADLPVGSEEAPVSSAPTFDQEELDFFETEVRPLLAARCYSCHSNEAEKLKGGLRLDAREALLDGGNSGPALVPGDVEASLLVQAVRYADEELQMPPKERLTSEEVRTLERWIELGAPWPEAPTAPPPARTEHGIDVEAGRAWWSFQPPVKSVPPEPRDADWAWSDIDRFLLAEMEEHGVAPVEDASDRAWLRRVSLDLAGLPPTLEEIAAFEADRSPERHAHVVDRLLASPRFGERWGRHWLDVARYAESSGKDSNVVYPHAWRYRDWVVDAFDVDLPYDRFLVEQIAGDLLPAENDEQRASQAIATGYLALGTKSHNARDRRQFEADLADEQIDALSQGMLGLTIACARCHDHEFDPIPTEDYYALAGIFRSSETLYGTLRTLGNRHPAELVALPDGAGVSDGGSMDPEVRRVLERQREFLERRYSDDGPRRRGDDAAGMQDDAQERVRERRAENAQQLLDALLARFDDDGRPTAANRVAMGVREGRAQDAQVLARGELDAAGARVPRGVPQVMRAEDAPAIESGSGRLELARWVASPANPLTARVWVNRVWLHMFGRGLVATPDNFGASGELPSHPELLDWLAVTFVEDGWSTKALVRRIALSHAYRLASRHDASNAERDPEVVLLWRSPERRLDAEAIRDALLFAAGTLELERPAGSPVNAFEGQPRREQVLELFARPSNARSIYLPMLRDRVPEALELFDAADPSFVTGARERTSVATQALFLMNDAEVLAAADAFGKRLLAHEGSDAERVALGFELALGRAPSTAEQRAVKDFLDDSSKLAPAEKSDGAEPEPRPRRGPRARRAPPEPPTDPRLAAWSAFAQSLFQCAEFRYAG